MIAEIGNFLLLLCLVGSLYSSIMGSVSPLAVSERLLWSGRVALKTIFALSLFSGLILFCLLATKDYTVSYVASYTNDRLPLIYCLSAFWAGSEGANLLLVIFTAFFSYQAVRAAEKEEKGLQSRLMVIFSLVLIFLFATLIFQSNPFAARFPASIDGDGLNPLLQNEYMIFHPPLFLFGLAGLVVPFAYSLVFFVSKDMTKIMIRKLLSFGLVVWIFLTVGLVLGARWAYLVLGWGGYWAWDPVETGGLLPWICLTAFLHILFLREKGQEIPTCFAVFVGAITFFLGYFSVFVTRTGILKSIHSFSGSTLGWSYLIFLLLIALGSLLVYNLKPNAKQNREKRLLWYNPTFLAVILMLTMVAMVFVGMVHPVISEIILKRSSFLGTAYFNRIAQVIAAFISGVFIYVYSYRNIKRKKIEAGILILLSVTICGVFFWVGNKYGDGIIADTARENKEIIFGLFLSLFTGVILFWGQALQKPKCRDYAALLVHIGLMLLVLGAYGNLGKTEKQFDVKSGETLDIGKYKVKLLGINMAVEDNRSVVSAALEITKAIDGKNTILRPALTRYGRDKTFYSEVAIYSGVLADIYCSLLKVEKREAVPLATIKIEINPLVSFLWVGVLAMILGGAMMLVRNRLEK